MLDFLIECLQIDEGERMKPLVLLSHPVFSEYNKKYVNS